MKAAYALSADDMDGVQFAAFYSLQHRLARQTEGIHGILDRFKSAARRGEEAGLEFRGQANAPRRAGCDLFALDEAVVDVAIERRRRHVEGGGLADGDDVSVGGWWLGLADGDVPVSAQVSDAVGVEPVAVRRPCLLSMPAMTASG
ncbi:hypothetical protein NKH71_32360 [Mesorhizobium sp. M0983]|uniref:hypothetical protein n=1 Tax=Mesorhizobium sp. M0983 TaxID=2957040 RepID=UPI00333A3A36